MFYTVIDILGTIAFAISGVLVAMEKRLDFFGVVIIAFVTAIGGWTTYKCNMSSQENYSTGACND